ncbi:Uncharacterized protein At4g02000 [Linum perenne]
MRRRLEYLWAKSGPIQVSDLSNNFYLVRFSCKEDYSSAAFKGPWKIYNYYITVSQWSPSFNDEAPIKTIMTWVRLPKLPIHYFNEVAVSRIGNCIGRTVRLDLATAEGTRGRYERVCVEVDLTKPLLDKYMIEDRIFKVEYEILENVCFDCGLYGHRKENCSPVVPQKENEPIEEPSPKSDMEMVTVENDTGEWMTVQRRHRRKPIPDRAAGTPSKQGTKFSALAVEEVEVEEVGAVPTCEDKEISLLERQTMKLRQVLEEDLNAPSLEKTTDPKSSANQARPALVSNTNTGPTSMDPRAIKIGESKVGKKAVVTTAEENLVVVPVKYQNIAFQANTTELAPSKAKQPARSTTTAKQKAVEPGLTIRTIKKRAPKMKGTKPVSSGNTGYNIIDTESEALKTRKPPDRS